MRVRIARHVLRDDAEEVIVPYLRVIGLLKFFFLQIHEADLCIYCIYRIRNLCLFKKK
jgi:hypothetical protein